MRLINIHDLSMREFVVDVPNYAILSHRWTNDEITFKECNKGKNTSNAGYEKIKKFSECVQAYNQVSDNGFFGALTIVHWMWIDTGQYLLQELLAPHSVIFCNKDWQEIGRKVTHLAVATSPHVEFMDILGDITGIKPDYITGLEPVRSACFAEKLSWVSSRTTLRSEDMAYALLGLLNINMPLLYGEGGPKSFMRLQRTFTEQSDDESIFVFRSLKNQFELSSYDQPLASSPEQFKNLGDIRRSRMGRVRTAHAVTNRGVLFEADAFVVSTAGRKFSDQAESDTLVTGQIYLVPLHCYKDRQSRVLERAFGPANRVAGPDDVLHSEETSDLIAYKTNQCVMLLR